MFTRICPYVELEPPLPSRETAQRQGHTFPATSNREVNMGRCSARLHAYKKESSVAGNTRSSLSCGDNKMMKIRVLRGGPLEK